MAETQKYVVHNLNPIQQKAWDKVKQQYDVMDVALIKFQEQEGCTTFTVYTGGAAFLEITVRHEDSLV